MNSIDEMGWREADALNVPSEVMEEGIRQTVTYRTRTSSGGAGMGEYSATMTIVLSNGHVYKWDERLPEPERVDVGQYEQSEISF